MTESKLGESPLPPKKCSQEIATPKLENENALQGDTSGQQLYFVDFDLRVPPCCCPILPDLQLPKQNKAVIITTKSKSTKYSRRP